MENTQTQIMPSTNMKTFSHTQLLDALRFIDDLLSRPGIPYVLLDKTAQDAHNNLTLEGDCVTVGVKKENFQGSNLRILEAFYAADIIEKTKYTYIHNGIPIYVYILSKYGKYLKEPNPIMYENDGYNLPNPFDKYLKVKYLII